MFDNGERSGGTRFNTEKPGFFWAVPLMGLRLIAKVTMHGAKKYAPMDWACGQSFSTLLDCMTRHLLEVLTRGVWARDIESGEYSMAHLGWNVLCILHFMEQKRTDLDDVTKWRGVNTAERHKRDMGQLLPDEAYKGPMQYPKPAPIGSLAPEQPVYAPTGLKGFVHEANAILDEIDKTSIGRKAREIERIRQGSADKDEFADIRDPHTGALVFGDAGDWNEVEDWEGHPESHDPCEPTEEELDEALRRTIIEQQMEDTEATANMGAEAAMGRTFE
jgi:hypothetical protein